MPKEKDTIGAAILGFYGAIKICEREGYDPQSVFDIVQKFLDEQKATVQVLTISVTKIEQF